MFASSLLAVSSLLIASSLAQSSPYSKFINDANSLIAAATGSDAAQLNALYTWQATQTAVPATDLSNEYQEYLDAYMTTTSVPLPAWVTAIPSSLQPVATSFLQAEASLVVQDIAPIVSQNNEAVSLYSAGQAAPTAPTATSSNATVAPTLTPTSVPSASPSSGFVTASANITTSQASGNGTAPISLATSTAIAPITTATGSPTKAVTPPSATVKASSGAEKPAGVAVVAAVIGILGVVVLL